MSIVKPFFWKGDKSSMTNYGSISLSMVFSKVLAKVMYGRLSHHMHTNNIVPEQFGFRQGSSTENVAFKLTDSVLQSINQKLHVGGKFHDLAKGFNCVHHEILLVKFHYYGIQGTVANRFRPYLADGKQKTNKIITKTFLKMGNSKTWSSQGVNFGPLLFIIYITYLQQ
jgi:hypothetical protein